MVLQLFIRFFLGYFRLILLALAWIYWEYPKVFLGFYITQVLLDGLKKKQISFLHFSRL